MKNSDSNSVCPICGSSGCTDLPVALLSHIVCPRCDSDPFIGMVRERSLELALVDFKCRCCGHTWSDSCALPEDFIAKTVVWSEHVK